MDGGKGAVRYRGVPVSAAIVEGWARWELAGHFHFGVSFWNAAKLDMTSSAPVANKLALDSHLQLRQVLNEPVLLLQGGDEIHGMPLNFSCLFCL